MFGHEAKLPVDLMYGSNWIEERCVAEYARDPREGLQSAYALVREHCKAEHRRGQKDIYNEKVHRKPFVPGDLVWLNSGVAKFTSCPTQSVEKTASPMEKPLESPRMQGRLCIQDCKAKGVTKPNGYTSTD